MAINVADSEIRLKLRAAYQAAHQSDDRSTKNGALLVNQGWNVLHGYNHIMDGWGGEAWHHERPFKYWVTEHAERDVIFKAAAKGIKTAGLTLVGHWVACPDCARAIVMSGIVEVICHKQCQDRTPDRWKEMVETGLAILRKDVDLIVWDGKVGDMTNLNNGEIWEP